MPRYLLKPNPNRDEYVYWSTIVDAPVTGVMSRDEMKGYLLHGQGLTPPHTDVEAEERLARTDEKGHSLIDWDGNGWGQSELVRVEHRDYARTGMVAHEDIAELTRAMESGDWATVERLVEVEDDD